MIDDIPYQARVPFLAAPVVVDGATITTNRIKVNQDIAMNTKLKLNTSLTFRIKLTMTDSRNQHSKLYPIILVKNNTLKF